MRSTQVDRPGSKQSNRMVVLAMKVRCGVSATSAGGGSTAEVRSTSIR